MVQREIEQIYMQMNKTRKELSSLEGRLEGLTSTLRQMILNEQLVCSKIKYTKSPTTTLIKNVTQFKSSKGCFFKFQCQDGEYGEEIEEDARSNISSLSNTTLTDADKQNGDIIHEEIDDLYSKVIY